MGEDRTGEPRANHERLTVAQAAAALGITKGAVRSRIKRGTLPTVKEGGTVFVLLGGGTSQANQSPNTGVPVDQSELIEALRDQIEDLRGERDEWREQARITDRLLSAAMERIPAIVAPSEEREASAESASDERVVRQADASAANVVRAHRYSVDLLTMLIFAAGVGAAVSFANPLLISRMDSPLGWLLLLLWLLPPVFGVWLGRSYALSEADDLAALREERLHVRDGSDEAATLDARISYRESHAGDLGLTPLHAIFAGITAVLPGAAVGAFLFGIDTAPSLLVGFALGFLAVLFVLSGTYIGVGLVRRQREEAHHNAVGGVSAARSAGTSQALNGLAGTIIAAVIGAVIGTVIGLISTLLTRGG